MTDNTSIHAGLDEAQLAEFALQGDDNLPMEALAHIHSCPTCQATYARYVKLRGRVVELPREAMTRRELWSGVEQAADAIRIAPVPIITTPRLVRGAIAAGIVVFTFFLGRASARPMGESSRPTTTMPSDSLAPAERIQEAGTRYLTALSLLGETEVSHSVQGQGRDAAIATLYGATMELARQGRGSANLESVASLLDRERNASVAETPRTSIAHPPNH